MSSTFLSMYPAMSETMFQNPFSVFDGGFTPWVEDCHQEELMSIIQSSPKPVTSNSGSDEPNQNHVNSNSGSGFSDEPNREPPVVDERKRRRMLSNRDSARRSRMRKQKHLENLRTQVNRLKIQNRELTNRLRFVLYHSNLVRTDNDRLRSEHIILRQKLSDINQILSYRRFQPFSFAWPCNSNSTVTCVNEQIQSLIT